MDSCPKELEPYDNAFLLKEKRLDRHNYELGIYIQSAVASIMAKENKYFEKPIYEEAEEKNRVLTEKEKKERVDLFFREIEALGDEFNRSKGKS